MSAHGSADGSAKLEVVRAHEVPLIEDRRRAAGLKGGSGAAHNLVGLALSGGGLRSATFNLGLLQSLRKHGLLRLVDYMSSVSGGGYTAGYLARAAHEEPDFSDRNKQPASGPGVVPGSIAADDHLRFRDCGAYLKRPLEFLAEYVTCTIPVLTLFVLGLVAIALAVAIVWRTLDFAVVRDHLEVVGWNVELFMAFIPCVGLLILWLALEAVHRIDHMIRTRVHDANLLMRRLLCAALIALAWVIACLGLWAIWNSDRRLNIVPVEALGAAALLLFGLLGIGRAIAALVLKWDWLSSCLETLGVFLGPIILGIAGFLSAIPFVCGSYFPRHWQLVSPVEYDSETANYVVNADCFALWVLGFTLLCFIAAWALYGTVRIKRITFFALLLSPGVAAIILIANGSLGVGWLAELFGMSTELSAQQWLREPLLVFVALCVLVLFRYKRLLQSARPEANFWERVMFGAVVFGIVIGAPMALIGWVGRENVSGFATYRDPYLIRSDVLNWPAFLNLWEEKDLAAGVVPSDHWQVVEEQLQKANDAQDALFGVPLWGRNRESIFNPDHGLMARAGLLLKSTLRRALLCSPDVEGNAASKYLAETSAQRRAENAAFADKGIRKWLGASELTKRLESELRLQCLSTAKSDDNEVLAAETFLRTRVAAMTDAGEGRRLMEYFDRATDHLEKFNEKETGPSPSDPRSLDTTLSLNVGGKFWELDARGYDRASFNRLLLESLFPDVVKARTMVSSPIVVEQDQATRVCWLAIVSGVFLVLFALLPVNRLSPFHNFYRRKINGEFLAPKERPTGRHELLRLAEVKPHLHGGPYPIFVASLHFAGEQPADDVDAEECRLRGRCAKFEMSPDYCGTRQFGYRRTSESPWRNYALADVMAISGAALCPLALGTGPIYWILSAFNLRTGTWISRPKAALGWTRLAYVRPYHVYREILENASGELHADDGGEEAPSAAKQLWKIGSLADGGYADYLGIEPLLDRRCRLVIVADAGCNQGDEEFQSLGDVIRRMRLERGIEFLDWDDDRPLDVDRLKRDQDTRLSPQHFIMGRIVYPKRDDSAPEGRRTPSEGVLVYIQMTMSGDEGADLVQYHRAHATFPDEPTPNQFFSPVQVELFRSLGYHAGDTLCVETKDAVQPAGGRKEDDETEHLIQRLSDAYALAASAERKVDDSDFLSRLPFFPDLEQPLHRPRSPRRQFLDGFVSVDGLEAEASFLHDFERQAEFRRETLAEIVCANGAWGHCTVKSSRRRSPK